MRPALADASLGGLTLALLAGAAFLLYLQGRERRRARRHVAELEEANTLLGQQLARLGRAEDRFRVLVEKSSDATSLIDPAGKILYASPSAVRVLGYTPRELVGRDSFELIHPEDAPLARARLEELLAHPERDNGVECRALHKDGSWRWLACSGNNRLDEPGVQALVINYRDIGARKQAEAELLASRQRLQALSRQLLAAQETERRRLARELHDEIGQVLTVVSINLQALRGACGPEAAARLDESTDIVGRAIRQVRDLSLNLRPAMLDDFGLVTALRWYVERQRQRGGFEVALAARTSGGRLPADVEAACFRVAQEALTNVARHAAARHVRIDLDQREDGVELIVADDGTGFDLAAVRRRAVEGLSLGLLGMQERVELLGGEFVIDTAPGRGTTVRARLPAGAGEEGGEA
jgi:PAS domain S-box-containing protein